MFSSSEKRRLLVLGLVTIILSVMALINNLLEYAGEEWLVMGALAISFMLFGGAYWLDRAVYAAIGAYVCLAVFILIAGTSWFKVDGALVPSYVLGAIALPFVVTWVFKQELWGFLIPAYVLLAIIPIFYMENVQAAFVPSYVMIAIALPFIVVGLFTRKWVWAIPAYVLLALIPIFFLNEDVSPQLIPAYVLTAIALPFLMAFAVTRKWGWLVPSAILLAIALSFGLSLPPNYINIGLPVLALIGGLFLLVRAMLQEPEDKQKI